MMEYCENFLVWCQGCGKISPNRRILTFHPAHEENGLKVPHQLDERYQSHCPYCKKDTPLMFVKKINSPLEQYTSVWDRLSEANPNCLHCVNASIIDDEGHVDAEKLFCKKRNMAIVEKDDGQCNQLTPINNVIGVCVNLFAECKVCGKSVVNRPVSIWYAVDPEGNPIGELYIEDFIFVPCPNCYNDLNFEVGKNLYYDIGQAVDASYDLQHFDPACFQHANTRLIFHEKSIIVHGKDDL
jgi:hypothetical protein